MSDLGTLLELLHGAFDRFETCRATMKEWRDYQLSEEAMRRWTSRQGSRASSMYVASSRRAGSVPSAPYQRHELTEVEFDLEIPDDLFVMTPPAGTRVQNIDALKPGRFRLWWWRMMASRHHRNRQWPGNRRIAIAKPASAAFAAWEYAPLMFFVPLTLAWAAGRLPWNPAHAESRGLLFAIGMCLIAGTLVVPMIGLSLGDKLVEIIDNQPLTCVLVIVWPLYMVGGLGLFGLGPN